ncbi:hypothetical protein RFI_31501, partial [Reticulomyxa filosa]
KKKKKKKKNIYICIYIYINILMYPYWKANMLDVPIVGLSLLQMVAMEVFGETKVQTLKKFLFYTLNANRDNNENARVHRSVERQTARNNLKRPGNKNLLPNFSQWIDRACDHYPMTKMCKTTKLVVDVGSISIIALKKELRSYYFFYFLFFWEHIILYSDFGKGEKFIGVESIWIKHLLKAMMAKTWPRKTLTKLSQLSKLNLYTAMQSNREFVAVNKLDRVHVQDGRISIVHYMGTLIELREIERESTNKDYLGCFDLAQTKQK